MRWISRGVAVLAGVMGLVSVAVAGNRGLSPIIPAATQQVKYDAVYSMCGPMHSADQVPYNIERDNHLSPMLAIYSYFDERGIILNRVTGVGEPEPVRVTMLKSPAHGELVVKNKAGTSFTYHANPGHLGSDQMVFEVEILGKKFKVIQTVVIHNSGNLDYPTDAAIKEFDRVCPSDKGSSLDIIELPTEGLGKRGQIYLPQKTLLQCKPKSAT